MIPTLVSSKSKTLACNTIPKGMVAVREGLNKQGTILASSTSKAKLPTYMMVGTKACCRVGLTYIDVDTVDLYDGTVMARVWGT